MFDGSLLGGETPTHRWRGPWPRTSGCFELAGARPPLPRDTTARSRPPRSGAATPNSMLGTPLDRAQRAGSPALTHLRMLVARQGWLAAQDLAAASFEK